MEIKINTDSHITGSEDMEQLYKGELAKKLNRFSEYITTAEVYFADENRGKAGLDDKRCTIEVRIKNMNPEAVTHFADTVAHSFNGAVDKLRNLLDSRIGKLQSR